MEKKIFTTQDLCHIGIFTAIIAALAQVTIPMPYGVPMTLQTLTIPLAAIILGTKKGTITAIVYVLLGAVGVPVFAGFHGGLGTVIGPTGGFIISFPIMALMAGLGAAKTSKPILLFWLVLGAIVNYAFGMAMFCLVTSNTLAVAFTACVLPFIPAAIIKIIILGAFGIKLRQILKRANVAI